MTSIALDWRQPRQQKNMGLRGCAADMQPKNIMLLALDNTPMHCCSDDISCFLFLIEEAYSQGGLQTRKLSQTPLSVEQPQSDHWIWYR